MERKRESPIERERERERARECVYEARERGNHLSKFGIQWTNFICVLFNVNTNND